MRKREKGRNADEDESSSVGCHSTLIPFHGVNFRKPNIPPSLGRSDSSAFIFVKSLTFLCQKFRAFVNFGYFTMQSSCILFSFLPYFVSFKVAEHSLRALYRFC